MCVIAKGGMLRLLYREELVPGFVPAVCGTEFGWADTRQF